MVIQFILPALTIQTLFYSFDSFSSSLLIESLSSNKAPIFISDRLRCNSIIAGGISILYVAT